MFRRGPETVFQRIAANQLIDPRTLTSLTIVLMFAGAAGLMGVIAGTGNLLLIGMSVGVIMGVLLLNAIGLVVWAILVGVLLISGPLVMQMPALTRLQWLFSMLGFFLAGAAVLIGGLDRTPGRHRTPAFVWIAVAFVVYAIASLPAAPSAFMDDVGAIKRYFQYFGLAFVLAAAPFAARTVRGWLVFLLLLALLQLPFALWQKIVLVPMRVNMPDGVVPVDIVAGTFEANMTGAGNNIGMAYFLIAALVTLMAALRDRALRPTTGVLLMLAVAAPLALGETKIVLVLLPLALFAVYADLVIKRPLLFGLGAVVTGVVVGALGYVYVALQPTDSRTGLTFEQRLEENIAYNFGTEGYSPGASLNRGNVVPFWWSRHGGRDLQGTLVGHGLGASHGWQGAGETTGYMARRYPQVALSLTGIAGLLWDLGVIGAGLFVATFAGAYLTARRLAARASPGWDRALCRGLSASALMLLAMLFATDGMLQLPTTQVLMCATLGLIAWRARHPTDLHGRT